MKKVIYAVAAVFVLCAGACSEEDYDGSRTKQEEAMIQGMASRGDVYVDAYDASAVFEAPLGDQKHIFVQMDQSGETVTLDLNVPGSVYGANSFEQYYMAGVNGKNVDNERFFELSDVLNGEMNKSRIALREFDTVDHLWIFQPVTFSVRGFSIDATSPRQIKVSAGANTSEYPRILHFCVAWGFLDKIPYMKEVNDHKKLAEELTPWCPGPPAETPYSLFDYYYRQIYYNHVYVFQTSATGDTGREFFDSCTKIDVMY